MYVRSAGLVRLMAAVSLVAFAACDSENGPDLSGSWSGSVTGQCATSVSLTITEGSGGVLSGTATLAAPVSCGFASAVNYSVSGEHDHPSVQMTLTPTPGQNITATRSITGNVGSADNISASLDGEAVTLVRQ